MEEPGRTARAPSQARLVGMDSGLPFRPPYPLRRHRGHARVALKATGPCRAGHTCKTSIILSSSSRRVTEAVGSTAGEHSRAARRELRREALRRAARRNEGRGIRDGASEQDGTEHYEKAGRQSGRAEQRLDSAAGCRPEVVWGVKTRTGRTPASTRVLHNGVAHGTPFLILTPVRSTPLAPARARRSWQSSCWGRRDNVPPPD